MDRDTRRLHTPRKILYSTMDSIATEESRKRSADMLLGKMNSPEHKRDLARREPQKILYYDYEKVVNQYVKVNKKEMPLEDKQKLFENAVKKAEETMLNNITSEMNNATSKKGIAEIIKYHQTAVSIIQARSGQIALELGLSKTSYFVNILSRAVENSNSAHLFAIEASAEI